MMIPPIIIIVIVLIILAVVTALPDRSDTTPAPTPTATVKATPKPTGSARPARVRARASVLAKRFSSESSTIIPEAALSPYEVIAQRGQEGATTLMAYDRALSDRLKTDLQWPDTKPGDASWRELKDLDAAYRVWETELWRLLNAYANEDMNELAGQVSDMKARDPSECPTVQAEMLHQPDSDTGGRQGFAAKSRWLTAVGDRWQECNETQAGVHD